MKSATRVLIGKPTMFTCCNIGFALTCAIDAIELRALVILRRNATLQMSVPRWKGMCLHVTPMFESAVAVATQSCKLKACKFWLALQEIRSTITYQHVG